MNISQEKINDLDVLLIDQPGSQAATAQIWFRAGSSLEEKGDEGIAHFLEHMFFKGTPKRPGAKIASDVESFGGEINAFTSFDYTCYYINTPNSKLKNTVNILMDMVSNPKFLNSDITPERDVVWEEYRRSQDNPNQYNFQMIQNNSFLKTYAHPILGYEKTIKNFSRNQLLKFRKNFYNTSNSMLILAGDIKNKSTLLNEIKKFKLPKGPKSEFKKFKLKSKPQLKIHNKEVRMATITMTIEAQLYESKAGAIEDLALNALGYGESSLLYKDLVLKESICNASSASTMFLSQGGTHFIRFSCPVENLNKAFKEFESIIKETINKGLTERDIQKIKSQYIASKIYEKETIESFAFSLGHGFGQNGDIKCEESFIKNLSEATTDEVNDALKKIFSKPIHMNVQIPQETKISNVQKTCESFLKKINSIELKENKNKKTKSVSKFDEKIELQEIIPGVKLLYRHNQMTPTFNLYAFIKGSLTEENENNNGIHHLLTNLISKGCEGYPYEELKITLDNFSSSLQGFAGKNAYGLNMHGLSQHTDELLEIFLSSLLSPEFNTELFEHDKKILERNLMSYEEDALKQCFKIVGNTFFPNHSYSQRITGTLESIKNIHKADIVKLHSNNLKSKEMVITYCGDQPRSKIERFVKEKFKDFHKRSNPKTKIPKLSLGTKERKIHLDFEREQTQIFIGHAAFPFTHKDDIYLKMLTSHLNGQSSELFVDVRDNKGLCYSVQPIHFSALEAGYWGIYMASGHDKTPKAIEAINTILNRLQKTGFSKAEFYRVKKMIQGQEFLNVQTNDDYAQIYSVPVLQGLGVDHHYDILSKIEKTKFEDFNKFLSRFLKTHRYEITVGRSFN